MNKARALIIYFCLFVTVMAFILIEQSRANHPKMEEYLQMTSIQKANVQQNDDLLRLCESLVDAHKFPQCSKFYKPPYNWSREI